jgi:subtilisin family serine protease
MEYSRALVRRSRSLLPRGAVLVPSLLAVLALMVSSVPPLEAAPPTARGKIDPALVARIAANPAATYDVIVQAQHVTARSDVAQRSQRMAERVRTVGGSPRRALGLLGATSARLSGRAIAALAAQPDVEYINEDTTVHLSSTVATDTASIYAQADGAAAAWQTAGVDGTGVAVAVIDSGIAPNPDIASRILVSVDLTLGTGVVSAGDPGGHGTHVAGIIAGNGPAIPATLLTPATPGRTGVAPNANLISLRVLDANGAGKLSDVIAALQWAIQHRAQYNIRVINLSLGAPATTSYLADPLAAMAEIAWHAGIAVVTASGNLGPAAGTITTPAYDPFVIAVGAIDDVGTPAPGDDVVAPFTSVGPSFDGLMKPDLAAPGRRVVSLRVPGSTLDLLLPNRIVDTNYFRLSGTSQAAPQVAGAAALLLQKNAGLKPDQVKDILTRSARPVTGASVAQVGAGALDVNAALLNATSTARPNRARVSDAFARMVYPLIKSTQPLIFRDLTFNGGVDSKGVAWSNVTWDNVTWDNVTWDNVTWDNVTWDNVTWDNVTWDTTTWDTGAAWDTTSQLNILPD